MLYTLYLKIKKNLFKLNSKEFIYYLDKVGGVKVGKGTHFFDPGSTTIDCTRPWLLEIGEYVKVTKGVTILTHDYSLSVLRRCYGEWIGEGNKTIIGDNCFLGIGSIILMGSKIGKNTIVGAGSVVHGVFPDNVIIAGTPARVIGTLDDLYKKRKQNTIEECIKSIRFYKSFYNKDPKASDLQGFKFLFAKRDSNYLLDNNLYFDCNGDEPKEVENFFYKTKPIWNGFEELLQYVTNETRV